MSKSNDNPQDDFHPPANSATPNVAMIDDYAHHPEPPNGLGQAGAEPNGVPPRSENHTGIDWKANNHGKPPNPVTLALAIGYAGLIAINMFLLLNGFNHWPSAAGIKYGTALAVIAYNLIAVVLDGRKGHVGYAFALRTAVITLTFIMVLQLLEPARPGIATIQLANIVGMVFGWWWLERK